MLIESSCLFVVLLLALTVKLEFSLPTIAIFLNCVLLSMVIINLKVMGPLNILSVFLLTYSWVINVLMYSSTAFNNNVPASLPLSLVLILLGGVLVSISNSQIIIIFGFECMVLSSLFLLNIFSKSERVLESLFEMFVISIIGSLLLLTGFALALTQPIMTNVGGITQTVLGFFYVLGFGVKVPVWPFTSWLLKAHVEASTEFSIFLSGFLVNFGVIGFYKIIISVGSGQVALIGVFVGLVGIIESSFRLWGQVDLNSIVAITTIIETNWLVICLCLQTQQLLEVALLLVLVHCFTTTIEFSLVELLYNRFNSRSLLTVSGVGQQAPILNTVLITSVMVIIGLPGTIVFILKFIFFFNIVPISQGLAVTLGLFFFVILPIFFISLLLIISGGGDSLSTFNNTRKNVDLTVEEFAPILICIVMCIVVGISPVILI